MKFHIHIFSLLMAILHFIRVFAEIFKKLNTSHNDTEYGIWISKCMQDEDYTRTSFDVFEFEDTLNLSSCDTEDGSWTSELTDDEECDSGRELSASGDEGNSKVYTKNSDDACWTSELTSKQTSEETEIKNSASVDEGNPNGCIENLNDYWTSELTSKQDVEETEMKLPASVDEEYLQDWFANSDEARCVSDQTSKQDDENTKINLASTENEEYLQDWFAKPDEARCVSDQTSKQDDENTKIKLASTENEEYLQDWFANPDEARCVSVQTSKQDDENTRIKLAATENEGNLNNLSKFEDNSKTLRTSNLPAEEIKSNGTYSEGEDDPNSFDAGPFMCDLFEKQMYTDVNFYFKGTPFLSAHRAVLATKCSIFEDMLFGNQNNEIVGMEIDIQIEDLVPCHVFTSIVRYFYTNDIELSDDYTVLEIFAAAKSFHIRRLFDQCKLYIESIQLTENNVCSILEVCIARHINGLKTRCFSFIQKNTFRVISSTDFETCTLSTVQQICKLEHLNLNSEVELLEAVLRWVSVQKVSKQTKKEFTRCLIKYIRLLSFTPKEFSNVIQRHTDLMTPEEGLQILIYLSNPSLRNHRKLPKWCNKNLTVSQVDHKNIQKPTSQEYSRGGKIQISLKPTKIQQEVSELTAFLHMRCIKGIHQIKSIKFSFESIADEGCELEIQISVSPNGPSFLKKRCAKSRESTFSFKTAITVYTYQTVQMEVKAKSRQSCKFLEFDRWYNDPKWDFGCFFISKPNTGRLYFISEVEYEPLAPELVTAPGDGFKSSGN